MQQVTSKLKRLVGLTLKLIKLGHSLFVCKESRIGLVELDFYPVNFEVDYKAFSLV